MTPHPWGTAQVDTERWQKLHREFGSWLGIRGEKLARGWEYVGGKLGSGWKHADVKFASAFTTWYETRAAG